MIGCIKNPSMEILQMACSQNGYLIKFAKIQTLELCKMALKTIVKKPVKYPEILSHFQYMDEEMIGIIEMYPNIFNMKSMPKHLVTEN